MCSSKRRIKKIRHLSSKSEKAALDRLRFHAFSNDPGGNAVEGYTGESVEVIRTAAICDLNWTMCSSIELFPHEHELGLEVKFIFIVGWAVLLVEGR